MNRRRSELSIVISFAALIAGGTVLLLLPFSTQSGFISPLDALFTATSAACVTGLIVVDTGSYFTPIGQGIILALVQLGALGIITFSSFFAILLGKKMPLKQREVVRKTHYSLDPGSFLKLLKRIVTFTFTIEGVGALLLFILWRNDFDTGTAIWQSVFHAISAFCNAGFSLFHNSLIDYQTDLAVNFVFISLILIGGIGFLVIYDVERMLLFRENLSLHSRVVLITTGLLLLLGTVGFFLFESANVLRSFSAGESFLIALFQSVTARTAGFNTIDFGLLTNSTLVMTILLMFVGGSPGSTAGGIKTTTFALLTLMAYNRFRGHSGTHIFHRTIPERVLGEVVSIVLVSLGVVALLNFTLQWTEIGSVPHTQAAGRFIQMNFESVSAFGTVGLSTGITSDLSTLGKLQIILLMFVGRVGPLATAVAISRRHFERIEVEYYRENVMVG